MAWNSSVVSLNANSEPSDARTSSSRPSSTLLFADPRMWNVCGETSSM
jgi:hypothetical protein